MAYFYSVASFRPNVHDNSRDIPFAVLVEKRTSHETDALAIVGQQPITSGSLSQIGETFAKHARDLLEIEIGQYHSDEKMGQGTLLDYLADNNQWSFNISVPSEVPKTLISKASKWPPGIPHIQRQLSQTDNALLFMAFGLFTERVVEVEKPQNTHEVSGFRRFSIPAPQVDIFESAGSKQVRFAAGSVV